MKRSPLKRKSKTPLAKVKDQLWELCKQLTRQKYGYSCYTCGAYSEHPHTGHFFTDSICSTELSYALENLRPQCYRCNINLSGNWPAYLARMKKDCGDDVFERYTEWNRKTIGKKYDILWYQAKVKEYEAKAGDDTYTEN